MVFDLYTTIILMIAFLWSGFIRAGLGFGGAGLMYPIALLAVDSVLFLVPIISIQLIIFSSTTLIRDYRLIDWASFWKTLIWIFPTFMVGVFGLISLPDKWVLFTVYGVVIYYSITYILNLDTKHIGKWLDAPSLVIGGYVSGLSLSGAPLIAAVAIKWINRINFRATIFVLWIVLVVIKLFTLAAYDVDLQLQHQLWLFPCALVGHLIGLRVHERLLQIEGPLFYRWLGTGLLCICIASMIRNL